MSPAKRLGIDKTMRLRRRADFLAVQQAGTKIHGRSFLALVVPTSGQVGRLGVTVTRRVGNAVTRNRIKRLVRDGAARIRTLAEMGDELHRIRARIPC